MKFTIYSLARHMVMMTDPEGRTPAEAFRNAQADERKSEWVSEPGLYVVYPTETFSDAEGHVKHRMTKVFNLVGPTNIHRNIEDV